MADSSTNILLQQYPSVSDLRELARKRLPHISWEYLDCGTGDEHGIDRNLQRLSEVTLVPRFMMGELNPDLSTSLLGVNYRAPFGVSPVGLSGLMWPGAEKILARTAAKYRIPYGLSTVATQTPETIGPLASDMGWFQLYPPREDGLRDDILKRARDNGFETLVVTADVPLSSRRERTSRAGLRMPPKITAGFVYEALKHPAWTWNTLRNGLPRLRTIEKYAQSKDLGALATFVGQNMGGTLSWDYLKEIREGWDGPLILKGVLHPDDAEEAISAGVDGIQVSNHGARQFDGTPGAIDSLPSIVERVNGRVAILFDSGVRSGLDIIRALALGADFVLLGRAFLMGVAALGARGGDHTVEILMADLKVNMANLGCETIAQVKENDTVRLCT